jgi:hypothetical protein
MRTHLIAIVGFAILATIVVAFHLAPDMASGAAPLPMAFGGSNGIPVELPPLW